MIAQTEIILQVQEGIITVSLHQPASGDGKGGEFAAFLITCQLFLGNKKRKKHSGNLKPLVLCIEYDDRPLDTVGKSENMNVQKP